MASELKYWPNTTQKAVDQLSHQWLILNLALGIDVRQPNRRRRFSNFQHSGQLQSCFRVTCGDLISFEARTSQFLLSNTQGT